MVSEKRMLVVEDDPTVYPLITRMIHRMNPKVTIDFTDSAEGAEDLVVTKQQKYDVILSDVGLAGAKTGVDLVKDNFFKIGRTPFVLASANTEFQTRMPYLAKPFRYEEVVERLGPYVGANAVAPPKAKGGRWLKVALLALVVVVGYLVLTGQTGGLLTWIH